MSADPYSETPDITRDRWLARALIAAYDGQDDAEAIAWARAFATAGNPMEKYQRDREAKDKAAREAPVVDRNAVWDELKKAYYAKERLKAERRY
jgi:hypothetical protein